jgi:outer membrane biosynthesis protein TonB
VAEPASEPNLEPRFMSPATIGASPALMASKLVYAPRAGYPALAKMTHVQGKVMVQAVVGKSGHVIRAEAISGHHLLRGAAVREVYGRRYRPYVLDDRARDVATIVTVDFRLR